MSDISPFIFRLFSIVGIREIELTSEPIKRKSKEEVHPTEKIVFISKMMHRFSAGILFTS
jgi:hypothetical protein